LTDQELAALTAVTVDVSLLIAPKKWLHKRQNGAKVL
jgi:hypothetical protein